MRYFIFNSAHVIILICAIYIITGAFATYRPESLRSKNNMNMSMLSNPEITENDRARITKEYVIQLDDRIQRNFNNANVGFVIILMIIIIAFTQRRPTVA